jgi:hypothetical protein
MAKVSDWIDANPRRFRLVLLMHTGLVCAVLLIGFV